MLVNAVVYVLPADKADEAARILGELRAASLREPGCVGYEVARGADGVTFVLYETWRDQAALDAHYETEHFTRLGTNGLRPLALSRQAVKGTPLA